MAGSLSLPDAVSRSDSLPWVPLSLPGSGRCRLVVRLGDTLPLTVTAFLPVIRCGYDITYLTAAL